MPATAPSSHLDELQAQLDAVEQEADRDPIGAADDLDAWANRENRRAARRLQLEHQIREAADLGGLIDIPEYAAIARVYLAEATSIRRELSKLKIPDQITGPIKTTGCRQLLEKWARDIAILARKLPARDPAVQRFLDTEWARWVDARNRLLRVHDINAGSNVPWPEDADGNVPGGGRIGYHRPTP